MGSAELASTIQWETAAATTDTAVAVASDCLPTVCPCTAAPAAAVYRADALVLAATRRPLKPYHQGAAVTLNLKP
jgi:hypothetical protein